MPQFPRSHSNAPGIYVPENWGQFWYPALSKARNGLARAQVAFMGSSETQGYFCSNLDTTSYFALVKGKLQKIGGDGGSGFRGMQYSDTFLSGLPSGAYNRYKAVNNHWVQTLNGGTISTPTFDFGPSAGALNIAGGATVDIPFKGKRLALWFFNAYSSSPFTYSIDGGAPTTVTPGAGMGGDIAMISLLVSTSLSTGSHTVRITGGTNAVRFAGIDAENDTGVVCNNYAIAGMQSDRYSNADGFESGTYMGGHRFRNRYGVTATETTPDLLIITVPPNDAIKSSQTYTSMTTVSGNATVNGLGWRQGDVGRSVSGTGIPAGATVVSVNEAASAVLSANATASGTVTLTVTNPRAAERFEKNWENYLGGVLDNIYGGGTLVSGKTDIVIVDPIMRISSDTVRPTWRQIEGRARAIADLYGAAYINVGGMLGQSWSRAINLGYMGNENDPTTSGNDDIHPSDAGHAFIANQILKIIV